MDNIEHDNLLADLTYTIERSRCLVDELEGKKETKDELMIIISNLVEDLINASISSNNLEIDVNPFIKNKEE